MRPWKRLRGAAWKTIYDKSRWPKGPWRGEPDRLEFKRAGFYCLAVRASPERGGYWLGYVGVPEGHPLWGKDFWDEPEMLWLDVHGGVSLTGWCDSVRRLELLDDEETVVCRYFLAFGWKHLWWIGFDCAHRGDLSPISPIPPFKLKWRPHETYKDLGYVIDELKSLASQLRDLAKPK